MRIEEVSLKATTAILLAEVKEHLRIDGTAEDGQLNAFIATAERMIEATTGLALISRQFDVYLSELPRQNNGQLVLPVRPLQAVNSIHLKDNTGADMLWPISQYIVQTGLTPYVCLAPHMRWPAMTAQIDGIRINITAGFGADWNAVPADIHQALLLLITTLYFNRGDSNQIHDVMKSSGIMALLSPYKRVRL
ncbi:head-tail connector protein [Kordiimonas aquimaris]|uniref:head-tail connector protein n=1 Tax=Kordiimonas aquimaris TaxID=707591 RepID=UPI0021D0EE21|nr:head-tail connector protein [Kordiimonas aquimaris]